MFVSWRFINEKQKRPVPIRYIEVASHFLEFAIDLKYIIEVVPLVFRDRIGAIGKTKIT